MSNRFDWKQVSLSTVETASDRLFGMLCDNAQELGVKVLRMDCGALLVDAGIDVRGSIEAGRIITELSQGGLSRATVSITEVCGVSLPKITVESFYPAAACLDMQMGLEIQGTALLSGPIRLFVEELRFVDEDIPLAEAKGAMVAIVEPYDGHKMITDETALAIAESAHIDIKDLRIVLVPATGIAGAVQVCGRPGEDVVLTVGRSLLLDPRKIVHLISSSPVNPIYDDNNPKRLGADDFLHYMGECYMTWQADPGEDVSSLADTLCFHSLAHYGTYFEDLLDEAGGDFFKIPGITDINRIARVTVNDVTNGKLYSAGELHPEMIAPRLLSK